MDESLGLLRALRFPILLIAIVLAVPVLPFLGFGESLERQIGGWLEQSVPPVVAAGLAMGLLAADILLPVPSSVVSTFAAARCGFWLGAAAAWTGMTMGGVVGFWVARHFGRWAAARLSRAEELARIDQVIRRFGPFVVVLTRPIPVLAEASVLALGTTDLPWRRFLTPLALSNLGLAAVYAGLGHLARWPIALAASVALPVLAMGVARWFWPRTTPT